MWQLVVVLVRIMEQNLDKEADLEMIKSFGTLSNGLCGDLDQTAFFDWMYQSHTWLHKIEFHPAFL